MRIDGPMGKMKLSFKGAIKGNDFSGEVNTGFFGTYPFKGKKFNRFLPVKYFLSPISP